MMNSSVHNIIVAATQKWGVVAEAMTRITTITIMIIPMQASSSHLKLKPAPLELLDADDDEL